MSTFDQPVSKAFVFEVLPTNVRELMGLKEASLDSPYKTTALTLLTRKLSPSICQPDS